MGLGVWGVRGGCRASTQPQYHSPSPGGWLDSLSLYPPPNKVFMGFFLVQIDYSLWSRVQFLPGSFSERRRGCVWFCSRYGSEKDKIEEGKGGVSVGVKQYVTLCCVWLYVL